jgi:hypothetical protein
MKYLLIMWILANNKPELKIIECENPIECSSKSMNYHPLLHGPDSHMYCVKDDGTVFEVEIPAIFMFN